MLAARSARCRKKVAKKLQSCTAQRHVAHRHCPRLGLTTAAPTLAALRPAHDHARAEHARHARCTRVSLASDPRAPTLQHALARQKQGWRARVTGHWLTAGQPAAGMSGSHTRCKHARQLRCSRASYITHTLCMLSTSTVATLCREMMTMNEMMTNDTMKKTKDTMDDARECAPLVPARLHDRQGARRACRMHVLAFPSCVVATTQLGDRISHRHACARFPELCRCYDTTRRSHLPPACMCSLS